MAKEGITIRLESELIDRLEAEAENESVSRSEYIRQTLRERHESEELREKVSSLRDRLETRENRISELEEQLARRSQLEDKIEDVALEVREDRQERDAPFVVKWYRWFKNRHQ